MCMSSFRRWLDAGGLICRKWFRNGESFLAEHNRLSIRATSAYARWGLKGDSYITTSTCLYGNISHKINKLTTFPSKDTSPKQCTLDVLETPEST